MEFDFNLGLGKKRKLCGINKSLQPIKCHSMNITSRNLVIHNK